MKDGKRQRTKINSEELFSQEKDGTDSEEIIAITEEQEEDEADIYMALFLEKDQLGVCIFDVLTSQMKTAQITVCEADLALVCLIVILLGI